MAALLKSAESKDFVGSNPTLSATLALRRLCTHLHALAPVLGRLDRSALERSGASGHWAGRPHWTGTIGWLG